MRGFLPTSILTFGIYIAFTGSLRSFDILTGIAISILVGVLFGKYIAEKTTKALGPARWFWALAYFLKYITVIEFKAHIDVMKRTISGDINPGIVRIPTNLKNSYARTLVANSITNTPGTVVVDQDESGFYVNWIDVKTQEAIEAKKQISEEFEFFAEKILE